MSTLRTHLHSMETPSSLLQLETLISLRSQLSTSLEKVHTLKRSQRQPQLSHLK